MFIKKSKTKDILLLLAEIGVLSLSKGKFHRRNQLINDRINERLNTLIDIWLDRTGKLVSRGLIVRTVQKDGTRKFRLSRSGKELVARYRLEDMRLIRPPVWDGYWRIVAYDIPMQQNRKSIALSRKLHSLGLYRIQKSLWVSPWECKNEIRRLREALEIPSSQALYCFTATLIPNMDEVKDFFGIV